MDSGRVNKILRNLTLEEKIGQMIGCPFSGEFSNADAGVVSVGRGLDLNER